MIQVRTVYGPVPMKTAWDWPVLLSYNDVSAYAIVKGGRLPTDPELRLFYDQFESGYEGGANWGFRNWHPIPYVCFSVHRIRYIFTRHPVRSTTGGERDGGRGHNGGVWEWTSTVFDSYDGFIPSKLYPGYAEAQSTILLLTPE